MSPLLQNDASVFGLLMAILAFVFYTSSLKTGPWVKFYKIFPALLMCYLIPSIMSTLNVISPETSKLYTMAKNYLLPASLILMTISVDLKGILNLGTKSIIMFLSGTVGIVIGGPLAILIISAIHPETFNGVGFQEAWRGLATLAGSWIGGGANQAAMLEIYKYDQSLYSGIVAVDIIVANIWMAILLMGIGKTKKIDKWLGADVSAIEELKEKVQAYQNSIAKNPTLTNYMVVLGVAFGIVGLSHFSADHLSKFISGLVADPSTSVLSNKFFWLVLIATTLGVALSFTKAKKLEGYGASKLGSVCIYILVATIGMKMDVTKTMENPGLLAVGLVWMAIHVIIMIATAKLIKAPFFFLAVGSKANVGGAASAPVIASAFHPSLAPVGVLLAVLGYALGTYGAMICAYLMSIAS
ncbi:DUF819 family protein [Flammeovirga yaeyamensis]|uniref:DUF819 family protein n=1 Tax=Flammeovirga yaeyamensis TaxID=367791 RepID=A0AAX1N3L8_9BACT|nr:DUF819 family protein [Flammeovirga yaeyamensis]MBB3696079.1 putative membrane protein [Flammeovirga yaeyamensis]NMF34764.1 DUF819 family protein [Flammeovirga yaeyamensis]QWG00408.1 DUF819 family protein [Flammeovirga yaeyamensis]